MDVASIAVGTRWAEVIEQTLRSCHVAVILVGKHWLDIQPDGARRLDRDDDPTRAEISIALRLKLKIVPLLVAGAAMPDRGHLPAEIASVTEWQALRVDDDDFEHDATRLIRALEMQLGESATFGRTGCLRALDGYRANQHTKRQVRVSTSSRDRCGLQWLPW